MMVAAGSLHRAVWLCYALVRGSEAASGAELVAEVSGRSILTPVADCAKLLSGAAAWC